ncbi:MAG: hypothetical protein ACREYF_13465 [Gammaproteobacteria bacterium]
MSTATRRRILDQAGLLHPRPEAVTAPLFDGRESFFLALDKGQVKYEMLRAHIIDGLSATVAAEQHGYSRAAFYLVTAAFEEVGMRGLLDERRGRRGPPRRFSSSLPVPIGDSRARSSRRKSNVASA